MRKKHNPALRNNELVRGAAVFFVLLRPTKCRDSVREKAFLLGVEFLVGQEP